MLPPPRKIVTNRMLPSFHFESSLPVSLTSSFARSQTALPLRPIQRMPSTFRPSAYRAESWRAEYPEASMASMSCGMQKVAGGCRRRPTLISRR